MPGSQTMTPDNAAQATTHIAEYFNDVYTFLWLFGTFVIAGLMSTLKWLNTPLPNKTVGRAILAFLNGVAISLLTALFLGDKVVSQEISVFQFTFYVMIASFGGSHIFDVITDFIMKSVDSAIARVFPEEKPKEEEKIS